MKNPLIRQGDGPAGIHRIYQDQQRANRELERMLQTATANPNEQTNRRRTLTRRSPAGDEQRLRGIPALTRGVSSTIPGTNPQLACLHTDHPIRYHHKRNTREAN